MFSDVFGSKMCRDKTSGDTRLAWLKLFETLFITGRDLIDKMVMLIKEELHHFTKR